MEKVMPIDVVLGKKKDQPTFSEKLQPQLVNSGTNISYLEFS